MIYGNIFSGSLFKTRLPIYDPRNMMLPRANPAITVRSLSKA